ncbi:MAG: DUF3795 domain-containing protein [Candidatus Bathyarchaeia archaeon]
MTESEELLAYCGFYCGDCLGYTGVIADAASGFMMVLEKHKFDRTAKCVFPKELKDYDKFCEMLGFMTGLRCEKICREREDSDTSCRVRECCRDRGFYACYKCDDFEICEKLKSLHNGLHYNSCVRNLKTIKKIGLEAWIIRGKRYCYWNEAEKLPLIEDALS